MAQHSDLLSKLLSNIEVIDREGERDRQTERERERETEREREKESLFHLFWNSLTSKAQSILFSLLSSVNTGTEMFAVHNRNRTTIHYYTQLWGVGTCRYTHLLLYTIYLIARI